MADADEAVLARAAELYAEGMALEDANEPQQALDRYRRAVRMADERKILARLQALHSCPVASASTGSGAVSTSREEDFQLWQAIHLSNLEARAEDAATAGAMQVEAPALPADQASSSSFAPPPRRQKKAHAPKQEEEEKEPMDEATEVADWFALRSLHKTLDIGKEPTAPSEAAASAAAARAAVQRPKGEESQEAASGWAHMKNISGSTWILQVEQTSPLLKLVLPEVMPRVLSLLDAYDLDRTARVCEALRSPARDGAAWLGLARRCLPEEDLTRRLNLAKQSLTAGIPHCWRQDVLLAPRLRADGVYIAHCGYRRRVQKGASITDSRESMYIRYFRLLRVLPEEDLRNPRSRILVLTYEGDLPIAVEALKAHPIGRVETFGFWGAQRMTEPGGHIRKVQERVIVGNYSLDPEEMIATVRYTDARNDYVMEFKLLHARKNGSRQNCRLTWERYEFTSLKIPQETADFDLRREQHYSPYAFARVRTLEHLL